MCEWEEKEGEEKERKKREKKKKKQGEKDALQFYIYKLPIDRPAALTGSINIKGIMAWREGGQMKKTGMGV